MKPAPNFFPSGVERDRLTSLKSYKRLYEGDQYAVLGLHEIIKNQYENKKDLVYISNPIPARVVDFYADFVVGDLDKMVIKASDINTEVETFIAEVVYENDLKEMISDIGGGQSEYGYAALLGWLDELGKYHIEIIPQDQYFPQSDGSIVIATYKRDPAASELSKDLLLLTEHYSVVNQKLVIERKAWKTDERGVITESYPMEKMAALLGKTEIKETETIDIDDTCIRQIDNTIKNDYGFGKSDLADIVVPLAEINERVTQMSTQFLKNLDAKMQLPADMFNEDGKLEVFEAIAVTKDGGEAKYITNENPLMTDAREHVASQMKMISFSTAVPMFELLKSAMPERVESLRIQLFGAIRRADRKRGKIKRAINDMFRIGFQLKDIKYDKDVRIDFADILPVDENLQANTESIKVTSGLTSKKSAMIRMEGYSSEEADEELKRIADEDKIAGIDIKNPPQL